MMDMKGRLVAGLADGGAFSRTTPTLPGRLFVAILCVSLTLVASLMMLNGLVIQAANLAFAILASAMLLLAGLRYSLRNREAGGLCVLRDFSEYCVLFMAITLLGVVSTYPIAALSTDFVDDRLARMDALIGFDWVGWYGFVVRHQALQWLGVAAYSTIYVSPAILLGYMAWTGQRGAAQRFLMTFWLAAVITLILFPLFPAKGPLAAIWTGPIPYMPTSALYQSQIIPELRERLLGEIDLGALRGLVCAPSFHTVSGVLYIAAAWPIARLRWPLLAMNVAMLLATPVEGNHYLTDMLLGLTVALLAIVIVRRATKRMMSASGEMTAPVLAAR